MARTLDPEVHAVKRDAFVDAAQRFIASGGYEQLSIQQLIDHVGASKGAFYHYFGSKGDLLEAVVLRMADQAEAAWQPILTAPGLSAGARLEGVFRSVAAVKAEQRDVVMAILDAWLSDDNAIVREKLRRLVAERMRPLLIGLVRQGIADGDFTATDPDATALVLVAVIQGSQELALQQFVGCQSGKLTVDDVIRAFDSRGVRATQVLPDGVGGRTLS